MACFGRKRIVYGRPMASKQHIKSKKSTKSAKHRRVSQILAALFYFLSIALAAVTLSSCSYSSEFSKSLYVAEIRRNVSQVMPELRLSVGYFGGCITIAENAPPLAQTSNLTVITAETRCIMNMYGPDGDDILEELSEELKNPTNDYIVSFLNETIPQARHLQEDVFHFAVPLGQLMLLIIGGAMMFTASTNVVPKKSYRYLLVLAFLFIVFAMSLMFATAFGSLQALHGLVNEQDSELPHWTINDSNDSIHFADRLYYVQVGQATMVMCFVISMGFVFAGGLKPNSKGVV